MKILGITGGSNTGKTSLVEAIRAKSPCNIVYFDADKELHRLYAEDQEVIAAIAALCPEAVQDGVVNRRALGAYYFASDANAQAVEDTTIDKIRSAFHALVAAHKDEPQTLLLLDMPLLLEIGLHKHCDHVLVTVCEYAERTERGVERIAASKGISLVEAGEVLADIQRRQSGLPHEERQRKSPKDCTYHADHKKLHRLAAMPHTIIDTSNIIGKEHRSREQTQQQSTEEALSVIEQLFALCKQREVLQH